MEKRLNLILFLLLSVNMAFCRQIDQFLLAGHWLYHRDWWECLLAMRTSFLQLTCFEHQLAPLGEYVLKVCHDKHDIWLGLADVSRTMHRVSHWPANHIYNKILHCDLPHHQHVIMWVSNYRYPIWTFYWTPVIGYPCRLCAPKWLSLQWFLKYSKLMKHATYLFAQRKNFQFPTLLYRYD